MKTRFLVLAACALACAACNNGNDENPDNGPVAARFISDITSATRASGTTWDNGDCIGITGAGYKNIPYVTEGDGNFVPKGMAIFYNNTNDNIFSAYYPYKDDSELTNGKITATADAAAQQDQPSIDFLFASGATGSTHNPEVEFTDKTKEGARTTPSTTA